MEKGVFAFGRRGGIVYVKTIYLCMYVVGGYTETTFVLELFGKVWTHFAIMFMFACFNGFSSTHTHTHKSLCVFQRKPFYSHTVTIFKILNPFQIKRTSLKN